MPKHRKNPYRALYSLMAMLLVSLYGIDSLACSYNSDCSPGATCKREDGELYGVCLGGIAPGNSNDSKPVYAPLDINHTYGNTCSFDVDCGPGSACVKDSNATAGTCLKRTSEVGASEAEIRNYSPRDEEPNTLNKIVQSYSPPSFSGVQSGMSTGIAMGANMMVYREQMAELRRERQEIEIRQEEQQQMEAKIAEMTQAIEAKRQHEEAAKKERWWILSQAKKCILAEPMMTPFTLLDAFKTEDSEALIVPTYITGTYLVTEKNPKNLTIMFAQTEAECRALLVEVRKILAIKSPHKKKTMKATYEAKK